MPRSRCVRTIIAEVIIYVGMFAVVGHLCQNLCERFMMQSELLSMKSDLQSLQIVTNNIGMAYDTLRDEIQSLLSDKECKSASSCFLNNPKRTCMQCWKKLVDVETEIEKNTKDFMQNFKKSTNNFIQSWNTPNKDESTFTERILRCLNLTDDKEDEEKRTEEDFCKCVVKCLSSCDSLHKEPTLQNALSNQSIRLNSSACTTYKVSEFPA